MVKERDLQIVVLADLSTTNGANIVTKLLISELERLNQEVTLFDSSVKEHKFYALRRVLAFVICYSRLRKIQQIEILYIPLAAGMASFFQMLILLFIKKRCQRILVHHHSYKAISMNPSLIEKIVHFFLSKYAEHIFLGEKMMIEYSEIWRPRKRNWILLNAGFAASRIAISNPSSSGQFKNSPTFLHYGKLTLEKGTLTALSAFNEILSASEFGQCILAGPTVQPKILTEIRNLQKKFTKRFHYIEAFDLDRLNEFLERSDFLLFPSTYNVEASPLVVLESQAAGLIAVTSDVGCLSQDVISPGSVLQIDNWNRDCNEVLSRYFLDWNQETLNFVSLASNGIKAEMTSRAMITFTQIREIFHG